MITNSADCSRTSGIILPASIKNEDTLITSFKASVYGFCSRYPDTPPLRGKPAPQSGNSLLDWA